MSLACLGPQSRWHQATYPPGSLGRRSSHLVCELVTSRKVAPAAGLSSKSRSCCRIVVEKPLLLQDCGRKAALTAGLSSKNDSRWRIFAQKRFSLQDSASRVSRGQKEKRRPVARKQGSQIPGAGLQGGHDKAREAHIQSQRGQKARTGSARPPREARRGPRQGTNRARLAHSKPRRGAGSARFCPKVLGFIILGRY